MARGTYAKETTVSVAKSKAEIERILQRYGATGFFSAWEDDPPAAMIGFRVGKSVVKLRMQLPDRADKAFMRTETGRVRSNAQAEAAWERAQRQRWRALVLIVKAKLEAVECGISTIEREFLADIMLADGTTVGDWAAPQLERMYDSGRMPKLLPAG